MSFSANMLGLDGPERSRRCFSPYLLVMGLMLLSLVLHTACGGGASSSDASPVTQPTIAVTENGNTDYQIIVPAKQTPIDVLAVKELTTFLKQATDADFKVFTGSSEEVDQLKHRIFVGISPSVEKILGSNPAAALQDQEHIVRNLGDDIFLFGKGEYGNLYAVYSFLENQVGCRWFTAYGDMKVLHHDALALSPFNDRRGFAFRVRSLMNWFYNDRKLCEEFLFRNYQNQLLYSTPVVTSVYKEILPGVHTSFEYIPPSTYFVSNPEFFTMNAAGIRVKNRQLCFSNPALRKQLTSNLEQKLIDNGRKGIISIDQNDIGGSLCECAGCTSLTALYGTPGGPLFDFLLSSVDGFCKHLKDGNYPEAYVRTLAYNEDQTETPPSDLFLSNFPNGRLPSNLIISFAPIGKSMLASFRAAVNEKTRANLEKWGRISAHVWVWYYPNPYFSNKSVPPPPFSNLKVIAEDIQYMKSVGVEGTYFEHDSGVQLSANFSELKTWLMLKLFQDPYRDKDQLVREFTDFYYGGAGATMRVYIDELETARRTLSESDVTWSWKPAVEHYRYLTPENLARWEGLFDQMETKTTNTPIEQFHVRMARMSLDAMALVYWQKLSAAHPDMASSRTNVENRLKDTFKRIITARMPSSQEAITKWQALETDFLRWVDLGKQVPKPLPAPVPVELSGIPEGTLIQVNPDYPDAIAVQNRTQDEAAAWGVANFGARLNPYAFGLYDELKKSITARREISESEVVLGAYKLYKLGTIKLGPTCYFWGGDWYIHVELGHLYENADAEYDAYASLKFESNRVLCDRVVLRKK